MTTGQVRVRRAAHAIAGVALGCSAGTIALFVRAALYRREVPLDTYTLGGFVLGVAFPIVGWIIATRRPGNVIGWIFLVIGLSQAVDTLNGQYSTFGLLTDPGSLPFAAEASWATKWDWAPGYVLLLTLSVLLFPDGRLPSRRWLPVAWMTAMSIVLLVVPMAVATWRYRGVALATAGPVAPLDAFVGLALTLQAIGLLLSAVAAFLSVAGLVLRFRRSRGIERRQLTWFVLGGAVESIAVAVTPFSLGLDPAVGAVVAIASVLVAPLLPIAAAIAILRYHLYEIDRIVKRTISYSVLTVILGIVFAGLILALQAGFATFASGTPLAVAVSTLVVATLFQPVRRRVQMVVDRRFDRSRYDAERTLGAFSARLRNNVDPMSLSEEIESVVAGTLAPTAIGVWIRRTHGA